MNDRAFSALIRERDDYTCQRCGIVNGESVVCAHCFGRGKPATRTDPDNAAALCYTCHTYLDSHPAEKRAFFRMRLGNLRFEALERRSNHPKLVAYLEGVGE